MMMKKKLTETQRKKVRKYTVLVVLGLVLLTVAVCEGMLQYSLSNPYAGRAQSEGETERVKDDCPWTAMWIDSIYSHQLLRDTVVVMPSGYRGHALFLPAAGKTGRTAVIVHGYKVRSESMLHIAYMYSHDFGFNVLLPDLYGHGDSEGKHAQMGWLDRLDVLQWVKVAEKMYGDTIVMHGISMGAATTMAASGEETPKSLRAFVEDCGYTSLWEEFGGELKVRFGLPEWPLMPLTSQWCKWRYGWSFRDVDIIGQVAKCAKPMLFIHGDKDTFVPTRMVYPLYAAKRGEKQLFIAKGSEHAKAYRDHHAEYTRTVKSFLTKEKAF